MNTFIGNIKNGYMFTNKLSGISKDDIIYNYDKIYSVKGKPLGHHRNGSTTFEYTRKGGKITKKYRVVEVYDIWENVRNTPNETGMEPHYKIKCELIEKVDYELSKFVSWRKHIEYDKKIKKLGSVPREEVIKWWTNNKLTRYNGLTKVIKIGDE
jgi:hypothetical protein